MKRILFINGSLAGSQGNTHILLQYVRRTFAAKGVIDSLILSEDPSVEEWKKKIQQSDLLLFATGTYWDSWGSPLQKFLEEMTDTEGTELWLGKPAGVLVSMHSVGGKGVLSRLQGVLNTFGALIPPCSGLVYSAVNQVALQSQEEHTKDLWQVEDIDIIVHNLWEASNGSKNWKVWPVDEKDFRKTWVNQEQLFSFKGNS